MQQIQNLAEAQTLALAIVDAIVDPFVVLDERARLVAASRSFYDTFGVEPASAHGQCFYDLCGGAWNVSAVRTLLEGGTPTEAKVDGIEVSIHFAELGSRTLLLNARLVACQSAGGPITLVVIKDVTATRQIEAEKQKLLNETEGLLRQQRILLKEMQHRVANSLQIIASILTLKAKGVASEETRSHLRDAHQRVMSVAEVQVHLNSVDGIDEIDVRAYLVKLCQGLAISMTGPGHPIAVEVSSSEGTLQSSKAVGLGLIVTELVINAIKYAFPAHPPGARVTVSYQTTDEVWRLTVADNGIGYHDTTPSAGGGLGTAIVAALAKQMGGQLDTVSSPRGLTVTVAGLQPPASLPLAA